MMWGYPGYWSWGGMLIMILSALFWVALISIAVVLVVRWLGSRSSTPVDSSHKASPMEILEQRYARGEIDEATFQRMREQLYGDKPRMPTAT